MYKADRILMFKKKTITFFPTNKNAEVSIDPPSPAKDHLTEEYKRLPFKVNKTFLSLQPNLKGTNLTAKACIPVLDAFTAGYMVTLPCDITVTTSPEYNHRLFWEVDWEAIGSHSNLQIGDMGVPYGFEIDPYKFETKWVIKTPPGYSVLITHPLNRFDLPFITLSGVVDSDSYNILPVNLPFFLKDGYNGVIKKGTPIAQIIPFKREDWDSKIEMYKESNDGKFQINVLKSVSERSYKNRFWKKKKYE
jgi:hypothetical protein